MNFNLMIDKVVYICDNNINILADHKNEGQKISIDIFWPSFFYFKNSVNKRRIKQMYIPTYKNKTGRYIGKFRGIANPCIGE
ncbi:MAG: hypothetical protein H6Q74_2953 [Firmicutes bacterium]|nr:hypothetical protein [Bacillota bacterium]